MARTSKAKLFEHYLDTEAAADAEAITRLYGPLPEWFPDPAYLHIKQALAALRNALEQFSSARFVKIVRQARCGKLVVPGSALDVGDFIKSANYLAHVQWALSLGKVRALEELGGSLAAKTYRDLRRGKDEQDAAGKLARKRRDAELRKRASQLREQNPRLTTNAIAEHLAPDAKLSTKQVRRILGR
jgi:hypothetical protein